MKMMNNHAAYHSKFQLVAGPCFIQFSQGVTLTRYRKFYDTKAILRYLEIYDQVHSKVQTALNNVPKLEPGYNTTSDDNWDIEESAAVRLNRKEYNAAYKKAYNKAIYDELGVSIGKFKKLIEGKMFEAFIKPIPKDIRDKFIHGNGGVVSERRLNAVHKNLPLIIQASKDNQHNIIPFIMLFGKSPKELKEYLGKGLWKRLCSNTVSRNKVIADYYVSHNRTVRLHDNRIEMLRDISEIPTTLLSKQYMVDLESLKYLTITCKGKWKNRKDCKPTVDLFEDTKRMLHRYTDEQSLMRLQVHKWSLRRLQHEHDELVQKVMVSKYNPKVFWWYEDFPLKDFCYQGYEVILLKSEAEIGLEGQTMQHCVGSYGYKCAAAEYLVYSVRKDGVRHSTIGMYMDAVNRKFEKPSKPLTFHSLTDESATHLTFTAVDKMVQIVVNFNQQYKRYNERLAEDDKANDIPELIKLYIEENFLS